MLTEKKIKAKGYFSLKAKSNLIEQNFYINNPKRDEIIIKVKYCGLCQSDIKLINKNWHFAKFPFVPGHEIIGEVFKKGKSVKKFSLNERVGVGWFSKFCMKCKNCKDGNENMCQKYELTCVGRNGGFANFVKIDQSSVFKIPKKIKSSHAASLLCAGWTIFGALKNFNIKKGSTVGILGIGGLGHLGIKFGKKLGYKMVGITETKTKLKDITKLGSNEAYHFNQFIKFKNKFDYLIITSHHNYDWKAVIKPMAYDSTLCFVSRPSKDLKLNVFDFMSKRIKITASPGSSKKNMVEMLKMSAKYNIYPNIQEFKIKEINLAIKRLIQNKIRYRAVMKVF